MLLGVILFCIFAIGLKGCKSIGDCCKSIWYDKINEPRIGFQFAGGPFRCCNGSEYSDGFHHDEFAAAQCAHQEKCAALQKQVDDETKSPSTDGLIVTISDYSGEFANEILAVSCCDASAASCQMRMIFDSVASCVFLKLVHFLLPAFSLLFHSALTYS